MPKRDPGVAKPMFYPLYPSEDDRQKDQLLDQCDAPDEARSRAARTQARICSPKSAMNA